MYAIDEPMAPNAQASLTFRLRPNKAWAALLNHRKASPSADLGFRTLRVLSKPHLAKLNNNLAQVASPPLSMVKNDALIAPRGRRHSPSVAPPTKR